MSVIRTVKLIMMPELKRRPVKPGSLNRAIFLLETIAAGSRKGSSLTEIVARTALPRPTIHRVLGMQIENGWVIRDKISEKLYVY